MGYVDWIIIFVGGVGQVVVVCVVVELQDFVEVVQEFFGVLFIVIGCIEEDYFWWICVVLIVVVMGQGLEIVGFCLVVFGIENWCCCFVYEQFGGCFQVFGQLIDYWFQMECGDVDLVGQGVVMDVDF